MKQGLIIVDIQNDYFAGGKMELNGMDAAGRRAAELLRVFRDRGWPTFHIQHVFTDPAAPFFLPNTPGVEIHDCVKPRAGEMVVVKHFPNSFRESSLLEKIRLAGATNLVICGAMSHMCIDATTRAAADFGFPCTLVHDACATRDVAFGGQTIPAEQVHGSFMSALGWAYAQVTSTADFVSSQK